MPDRERGAALIAEAVERLEPQRADWFRRLARSVSLAVLVEPGLLRRARRRLVPGADAGVESELWFSRLVFTHNANGMVLDPDVLEALRGELTATEAATAHRLVKELHAHYPPALRLEEELVWRSVQHANAGAPLRLVEAELRRALRAMLRHDDDGQSVARWAAQASARLPDVAARTDAARELAVAAALRTQAAGSVAALPGSLAWLRPAEGESVTIGVEALPGGVRFVESHEARMVLDVPRTSPLMLELQWRSGNTEHRRLEPVEPGRAIELEGLDSVVVIRTLAGRRYVVESEVAGDTGWDVGPAVDVDVVAGLEGSCVRIRSSAGDAAGFFVTPTLIVTSRLNDRAERYQVAWRQRRGSAFVRARERRITVLELSDPDSGAPLQLARDAELPKGGSWGSWALGTRGADGLMVTGTIRGGRFFEIQRRAPRPSRGAPVLVGSEVVGLVSGTRGDRVDIAPARSIADAVDRVRSRYDVVVSYAQGDRAWAEWIASTLEDAGYATVLDALQVAPGENFIAALERASSEAARTLAVLSPEYPGSPLADEESTAALRRERLIPVRVREVELRGPLSNLAYLDLVGLDEGAARDRLLAELRRTRIGRRGTRESSPTSPRFPGALPRIWNVPTRGTSFVGRVPELVALQQSLDRDHIVVVAGLGGVGKSELAVRLAHRAAPRLDIAWWVVAREPARILWDLGELAARLGLPEARSNDPRAAAEAARRELERRDRWLLVFDDAVDPSGLQEWLPRTSSGWVVITSRRRWEPIGRTLPLDALPLGDAAELLMQASGYREEKLAARVARRLGNLPLALQQAGAYLRATRMPFSDYLELLESELASESAVPDLPAVAPVWELSLIGLAEEAPDAADLLTLSAFLAADHIPRTLVSDPDGLPGSLVSLSDPSEYARATGTLERYALISGDADGFSVHRLLQQVARGRLTDADRSRWGRSALTLVDVGFVYEEDDPSTWPDAARVLPHALAACEHAEADDAVATDVARVLNRAGAYLWRRADYATSERVLQHALDLLDRGESSRVELASTMANLALVRQDRGDLRDAQTLLERALELDRATFGQHLTTAARLRSLASIHREQGEYERALELAEEALQIDETVLGPDNPNIAHDFNLLSQLLRVVGDFDRAQDAAERAVATFEVAYGPDHPEVAVGLANLGGVLRERGALDEAHAAFERALEIDERVYGLAHPAVATDLINLGQLLDATGDVEAARAAYERAIAIYEARLGRDHPRVGIPLNNLGTVLADLGDLDGAQAALERAIDVEERSRGPDSRNVGIRLNNLGRVRAARGDVAGARDAYERAGRIFKGLGDEQALAIVEENLEGLSNA